MRRRVNRATAFSLINETGRWSTLPKQIVLEAKEIPVAGTVISKFNARQNPGDVSEMVVSEVLVGVLEPVLARPAGSGYEVVVGSRRFAAAKKAGRKTIPAIIKEMTDDQALVESVIENLQRNELSEEEVAKAYLNLHEMKPKQWTQEAFGKWIGKPQQYVSRLLEAYASYVKLKEAGVVKAMTTYPTDEERVQDVAPTTHLARIEQTVKSMVKSGAIKTEKEADEKRVEIAKVVLNLPTDEAFKVIDRVKRAPEKPIEEIREEVLNSKPEHQPGSPTRQNKAMLTLKTDSSHGPANHWYFEIILKFIPLFLHHSLALSTLRRVIGLSKR